MCTPKECTDTHLHMTVLGCEPQREVVNLWEWNRQDFSANYRVLQAVSSVLYALMPSLAIAFHRGLMKQEFFDTGLPELKNCEKLNFFSLLISQLEYYVVTIRSMCWLVGFLLRVVRDALTSLLPSCYQRQSLDGRCLLRSPPLCHHFSLMPASLSTFPLPIGNWTTLMTNILNLMICTDTTSKSHCSLGLEVKSSTLLWGAQLKLYTHNEIYVQQV